MVADNSFANRLQDLRKKAGLSQQNIADRLGVSKPTIWHWEKGNCFPRPRNMDELARILGVTTHFLLSGSSAQPAPAPHEPADHAPAGLSRAIESPPAVESIVQPSRQAARPAPSEVHSLREFINAIKKQIADFAGTEPAKVTISLDY